MQDLTTWRRRLSTAGFGLSVPLLLLPLATMSTCGQTQVVSGVDLASVAPALVVRHVWYPGAWAYLFFDAIPLLIVAGLSLQALSGRRLAWPTLGASAVAFAALVAVGFIFPRAGAGAGAMGSHAGSLPVATLFIILGRAWQWHLAFYAAGAALLLPALIAGAELVRMRGRPADRAGAIVVASGRTGGAVALLGALGVLLGSWLPYAHFGDYPGGPTYPSIFNAGFPGSIWFAAEPVAVVGLGVAASLVITVLRGGALRVLAAGMLVALGVQTAVMFVGYAATGPWAGPRSQVGVGSVVGIIGGLALMAGGLIASANRNRLLSARSRIGENPEHADVQHQLEQAHGGVGLPSS